MKLSITTYSYGVVFDDEKFGAMDAIEKTKIMEFDGIEFTDFAWEEDDRNNIDTAKRIKERCAELGLDVVSYAVGADFINDPDAPEYVKKCIDFAAAMGATNLRHDITGGFKGRKYSIGYDDAIEVVAPIIRELTKYAEDKGVGTMTENHGFFSQDARRVEKLINTVATPISAHLLTSATSYAQTKIPPNPWQFLPPMQSTFTQRISSLNPATPSTRAGWFKTRACNYACGIAIGRDNLRRFIGE